MTFAICRTAKLSTQSKQASAQGHNRREIEVKNADPDGVHITLIGEGKTIPELVDERIEAEGVKPRSNAMKAQEIILSASPEYFRPDSPGEWGKYDPARLDAWQARTVQFLEAKYGANMVSLDLHLDEATPHLHAVVTPIMERERKHRGKDTTYTVNDLCAKEMFSKKALSALQSEYASALKPLGIQRGVKGSKAKHEDVKQFYTAVNGPVKQAPQIPPVEFTELPSKAERFSDTKLMEWLRERTEAMQRGIDAAVERMANYANHYHAQALAYEKKWLNSERRLLAMCREFETPEGVRAALDAKDAQIASQEAVGQSQAQTLDENRELLEKAQEAIEGLQGRVQVLEYENIQLTRNAPSKGPSIDL